MNMKENAAHVLDLFEAEQQSVLALDPRERGMQHHYSQTMSTCHELRQFIAKLSDTRANTPDSAAQGAMGDESACNRYKDSERAACVEAIRFTRQDVKYIWAAFIKYADCVDDPRKVIHDKAKALILCSSTEASDAGRQG